jgi:hypothetical protein
VIEKDRTIDVSGLDEQEITILITLVELLRKKQKY